MPNYTFAEDEKSKEGPILSSSPADNIHNSSILEDGPTIGVGRSGNFKVPGVSFLDETIMNWADDISLYGGTFAASFNRLPNEIDEEPGQALEQEGYIESALSPIREDYIANEVRQHLTYANGSFWDAAKTFAADALRPKVLVEASLASGVVGAVSKAAQAIPIVERLGAGVAEWATATTGKAAEYLGTATRGAAEVATFTGIDIAGQELVDIPVENIGDHIFSAALLGAGGGVILKGVEKVGGKFVERFFDSKKEFLDDLNEGLVYADRDFNCEIVKGANDEPLLKIEPDIPSGLMEMGTDATATAGAMATPKFKPLPEIFTWGPLAQSWNSESQIVRQMSEAYFGNMYSRTETGGIASVIDRMQSDRGKMAQFTSEYKSHFKRYKAQYKKSGLSSKEIKEAFEQRWIEGATEGGYTDNPIVNGLISKAKSIFKEYGEKGVEAKVFGDFEKNIGRANELYEHNLSLAKDFAAKAEDLTLMGDVKKTSSYFKELAESAEKEAKYFEETLGDEVSEEAAAFLADLNREAKEFKGFSKNLESLKDFKEQKRFFREKEAYTKQKALKWMERAQGQERFRQRILEKDYYPQLIDKKRITDDREGWLNSLERGIRSKNPNLTEHQLKSAIDDIDQSMYWNADPKFNADGTSRPRHAKTREIRFDQQYIKDYLMRDPLAVMDSYITSMGYKIAENETLERLGYSSFKEVKEKFLSEQGGHLVDEKAISAAKLLDSIPAIVSGQFDARVRRTLDESVGGEWLRTGIASCQSLNVLRYLGSLGISGTADLAANFAKGTTCRHIGGLIKHAMGKEIGGLTKEEAMAAGFCIDDMLGQIRHVSEEGMFTDLSAKLGANINKLREGVSSQAERLVKISGIHWVDGGRERVAASLNCLDIAKKILAGERKVGKLEGGIVDDIKEQIEKYRTFDKDGVEFFNISQWDNKSARADFEGEIRRGVRGEIFKPNIGDIPNAYRHPLAKVFSMFYSFSWGMWNSVILPMAASGRGGQLTALVIGTVGYEMLGEALRYKIRGKDTSNMNWDEYLWSIGKSAAERAPIISHLATGVNLVTMGQLGEYKIRNGSDLAAAVFKNGEVGSLMSDVFDAGKEIGQVAFFGKPLTQKGARRIVRALPYQNCWAVRPLFNIMISDLPEGRRRHK